MVGAPPGVPPTSRGPAQGTPWHGGPTWGTPHQQGAPPRVPPRWQRGPCLGYPPAGELHPGYPPAGGPHLGYTPLTSTACTCYTAGGMPLAFTQEDFLVRIILIIKGSNMYFNTMKYKLRKVHVFSGFSSRVFRKLAEIRKNGNINIIGFTT